MAGEREGGYKDNFLSGLIALTVCRLLPSWRSLIEITCTLKIRPPPASKKKELLRAGRWSKEKIKRQYAMKVAIKEPQ